MDVWLPEALCVFGGMHTISSNRRQGPGDGASMDEKKVLNALNRVLVDHYLEEPECLNQSLSMGPTCWLDEETHRLVVAQCRQLGYPGYVNRAIAVVQRQASFEQMQLAALWESNLRNENSKREFRTIIGRLESSWLAEGASQIGLPIDRTLEGILYLFSRAVEQVS